MDKVLSARLDESCIRELERVTRQLGMTKKQFLEEAIRLRAEQAERKAATDVWAETLGAWKREEPVEETARRAREAFEKNFVRHHR